MVKQSNKIAVIGGGSWATALVKMLCNNLDNVNWWMRGEDSVAYIHKYKRNPKYLQSVEFDLNKLTVSTDLEKIIADSEIIIIATPSAFLFKLFEGISKDLFEGKVVFSAVKGIIPEYN